MFLKDQSAITYGDIISNGDFRTWLMSCSSLIQAPRLRGSRSEPLKEGLAPKAPAVAWKLWLFVAFPGLPTLKHLFLKN